MKNRPCAILLAAALAVSLMTPAQAVTLADEFTDGAYTFTKVTAKIIPGGIAGFGEGYTLLSSGSDGTPIPYSDNLLLVKKTEDGGTRYNYLGADGTLHDLNQGRFTMMAPFSEGLAAVIDHNNKLGYIDTNGKIAIPCQLDYSMNQVSYGYGSSFHDGVAWMFSYDGGLDESVLWMGDSLPCTWTQIDSTGKRLTETAVKGNVDMRGPTDADIEKYNLACPNAFSLGLTGFTEDCNAPGIGTFSARFGTSDTGLVHLPTGKTAANGEPETMLYVVQRKTVLKTRYQSTAELTNVCIPEMDFNDFEITVTNPTDAYDSGTIALVLTSHMGTIHFVDYELAPHESKVYHATVEGHIGVGVDQYMVALGKGWGAYLNAAIITFQDDKDRDAYRAAVAYEENLDYYVTQGSFDKINAHLVLCNGQPGDDWLKAYTSIDWFDKTALDTTVHHDICKP